MVLNRSSSSLPVQIMEEGTGFVIASIYGISHGGCCTHGHINRVARRASRRVASSHATHARENNKSAETTYIYIDKGADKSPLSRPGDFFFSRN